jgi:transposase
MNSETVTRRRHGVELKAQVLRERRGASVAAIALAHGLNANLVHKWSRLARGASPASAPPAQFVPLPLTAALATSKVIQRSDRVESSNSPPSGHR